LSDAASRAMRDPSVIRRLAEAGVDIMPDNSPEAAARHLDIEVRKWGDMVRALGLRGT
jgi:tripartite-type tricarboxylate transporter receptor subunit TctC